MSSASLPYLPEATHDAGRSAASRSAPTRGAWPVAIFGVPFQPFSLTAAVQHIVGMVRQRRRGCVLAADMPLLLQARQDPHLQRIANDAELVVCASSRLAWASRWLGNALPRSLSVRGLVEQTLRQTAAATTRLFLVGSHPDATVRLAAGFQRLIPSLALAGTYSPVLFDSTDRSVLLRLANEASAGLVVGCLDDPEQRKWLAGLAGELCAPLLVTAAASLPRLENPALPFSAFTDALPRLVRRVGEACRTSCEFLAAFAGQRRAARSPEGVTPLAPMVARPSDDWLHVDAGSDLTRSAIDRHAECWRSVGTARHCALDVSHVQRIDATGLALLSQQRALRHRADCELVLVAPNSVVCAALANAHLAALFTIAASHEEAHQLVAARRRPSPQQDGLTRSLAWCGEIVAANADDVWQMTTGYIRTFATSGATLVIVDLARLRFVDGSGATLMLRVKAFARTLRAEVLFAHPQPLVRDVLKLAQIDALVLEGSQ